MTEDYVTAKIKEALKVSEGDRHAAQKLLVTWAVRDTALLIGFTKSHLKAIISARMDYALRAPGKADGDKRMHFSKKEIDAIVSSKPLGEKRSGTVVPPPKSSERHASAIRQLVAAFKKKK
ncbi:MAG: hypothetical protein PHX43_09025 [Alphaproteobacteria bacterium]|nr:hypothetical protein [Alphaproteobacteria bacterium]